MLIKLESLYFKKSLLELFHDSELVVAKVYDPRNMNRDQYKIYTRGQTRYICHEWHNTEKSCFSILSKDTEFNNSYVRKVVDQILITMEELYIAKGTSAYSDTLRKCRCQRTGRHMRKPRNNWR